MNIYMFGQSFPVDGAYILGHIAMYYIPYASNNDYSTLLANVVKCI